MWRMGLLAGLQKLRGDLSGIIGEFSSSVSYQEGLGCPKSITCSGLHYAEDGVARRAFSIDTCLPGKLAAFDAAALSLQESNTCFGP